MNILIVEDQEAVRVLAASLLRSAGHEVREAATVTAALDALDAAAPDAVILDLSLGEPSVALHARLRSMLVPVLVVSGLDADDAQSAAIAQGWSSLPKPFDPELLIAMVERLKPIAPPPPTERPPLDGLSSSPSPAVDPLRDRLRVVLDRAIYAGALVAVVFLATRGKLDIQTLAAILLVAGVRPHNLFELARGNGRAGLILPILLENLRGGTWLAR